MTRLPSLFVGNFLLLLLLTSTSVIGIVNADTSCCGDDSITTVVTDDTISTLITAWKNDITTTEETYGNINCWDTSSVTSMNWLFKDVSWNFNINCWDVSNVKEMKGLFYNSAFNNSLSNWDTSSLEFTRKMFESAYDFDQDLSNFNTTKVYNMRQMFKDATSFTGLGLEYWDVSSVQDFQETFDTAKVFNGNLSTWTPSSAIYMNEMFINCYEFEGGDLSTTNWSNNLANVITMEGMFRANYAFTGNVSNWILSSCTSLREIFYQCDCNPVGVGTWDISYVQDMSRAFRETTLDDDLNNWNTSSVTSFWETFAYVDTLSTDVSDWDVSNVVYFNHAFRWNKINSNFSKWDTSSAISMTRMFETCTEFEGIGLDTWDVSKVTDFAYMFRYATKFTGDTIVNWDISSAAWTDDGESCNDDDRCGMYEMFKGATSFNQDLCHWLINDMIYADPSLPVDSMFADTACTDTSDPDLDLYLESSMCTPCDFSGYTYAPTGAPTGAVTNSPTLSPASTPVPTVAPTNGPTESPTSNPTSSPTFAHTESPTTTPTGSPTTTPTASPTGTPTNSPTSNPTNSPTISPTSSPTQDMDAYCDSLTAVACLSDTSCQWQGSKYGCISITSENFSSRCSSKGRQQKCEYEVTCSWDDSTNSCVDGSLLTTERRRLFLLRGTTN